MKRLHFMSAPCARWILGLAVLLIGSPRIAFGQSAVWQPQSTTSGTIYYTGGNVGIGMTRPRASVSTFEDNRASCTLLR